MTTVRRALPVLAVLAGLFTAGPGPIDDGPGDPGDPDPGMPVPTRPSIGTH